MLPETFFLWTHTANVRAMIRTSPDTWSANVIRRETRIYIVQSLSSSVSIVVELRAGRPGFHAESESELLCNWRSVGRSASPSVFALSLSGTHDQILAVVKTVAVLFVVGRRLCRQDISQSFSPCMCWRCIDMRFSLSILRLHLLMPVSPGFVQQVMLIAYILLKYITTV